MVLDGMYEGPSRPGSEHLQFHQQLRALSSKLPDLDAGKRRLDPCERFAVAVLDRYQSRALRDSLHVASVGVRDINLALRQLEPEFVVYQTTQQPEHPSWRGKLVGDSSMNQHLVTLTDSARALGIPVFALCTTTPNDLPLYVTALSASDVTLVTRSATAAALASEPMSVDTRVLNARDMKQVFAERANGWGELAEPLLVLARTYFVKALGIDVSAGSNVDEGHL